MKLSQKTVEIATAVNQIVDIKWLNESQEQRALEWIVGRVTDALDTILPEWVVDAIVTIGRSIDIDVGRLANEVSARINIPFISEMRERDLILAILKVLRAGGAAPENTIMAPVEPKPSARRSGSR